MILKPMGIPGVCPKHQRGWTKEESDFLVKNYGIISVADIAVATGRTTRAVEGKIALLRGKGIPPSRKNSPLTQKEKSFIRDNRYLMSASRMAKILGRHEITIRKVARRMGVSLRKLGDYNPSTRYKDEDVRLIRALREDTPSMTYREIGEKFEISPRTAKKLCDYRYTADDIFVRELLLH